MGYLKKHWLSGTAWPIGHHPFTFLHTGERETGWMPAWGVGWLKETGKGAKKKWLCPAYTLPPLFVHAWPHEPMPPRLPARQVYTIHLSVTGEMHCMWQGVHQHARWFVFPLCWSWSHSLQSSMLKITSNHQQHRILWGRYSLVIDISFSTRCVRRSFVS